MKIFMIEYRIWTITECEYKKNTHYILFFKAETESEALSKCFVPLIKEGHIVDLVNITQIDIK